MMEIIDPIETITANSVNFPTNRNGEPLILERLNVWWIKPAAHENAANKWQYDGQHKGINSVFPRKPWRIAIDVLK